jgi:hypothetical protein
VNKITNKDVTSIENIVFNCFVSSGGNPSDKIKAYCKDRKIDFWENLDQLNNIFVTVLNEVYEKLKI